ncbi:MAG: discoidin domain-containing protein [Oscillospiraceae bacterium]|nr:discoidin domain-containing protein [Oscillospiraceae bacterium]
MRKKITCLALALLLLALVPGSALAAGPTPGAGENYTWPAGQALPHFGAPAAVLDGMDIRNLPFDAQLAAQCIQGVVNRRGTRLYSEFENESWVSDLGLTVEFLPDWKDAALKYRDELSGLVIYNPDIRDTANVANTIAGIRGGIAVSPALAETFSASPFELPVLVDLREVAAITDKLSAYRWMHANYWDQCGRRTISGLVPDGHPQMRDFATAVKAAIMWLDPGVPEEREVMKLFFDDSSPINTFYTGWWPDEGQGIAFASSYGVSTIPSDFYRNMTVYSGMSHEITIPAVPEKPALENGKIYVALLLSDGDNIQYCQGFFKGDRVWDDPRRGEVPIGYTFSPMLLDAGPQLLNWYYSGATENDVFVCGPSGAGYTHVEHWPNRAFAEKYAAISNDYFERSGFDFITMWVSLSKQRANWFSAKFPALQGMTIQNFTNPQTNIPYGPRIRFTNTNVPYVWLGVGAFGGNAMSYDPGIANMTTRFEEIVETTDSSRPQFYVGQASAWETTVSDFARLVEETEAKYPGRFVFVRPDHLMQLLNEAYGKPYLASLRKEAAALDAAPGHEAAKAFDGTISTGWQAANEGAGMLTVDLGRVMKLDRYVLKNAETNYLPAALNTKAWKLQYSTDGLRWRTADNVSGNRAGIVYRGLRGQSARYVRLLISNPGEDNLARVQELEIFASVTDIGARTYGALYSVYDAVTGFGLRVADFFVGLYSRLFLS